MSTIVANQPWHRIEQLCEDMDAEYSTSLTHRCKMAIQREIFGQSVSLPKATAEIPFRKKSHHRQHISVARTGSQNSLTCATYSTCLINSICHFRRKIITVFKVADKVAAFKAKLEMNRGIFDMFQTLVGVFEETEPKPPLSHLPLRSEEFVRIRDPFVNKPGESSQKKINCQRLKMTSKSDLKTMFQITASVLD